ncbi:MAG: PEP-CTERM sorting domain-containing protein, partial [Pseudomonadales bacterium]|nr:PEP-CTERM sorting domain-containing protein [Pseudomonadales bacterium]
GLMLPVQGASFQLLGLSGETSGGASAISGNGNVVVGTSVNGAVQTAYIYYRNTDTYVTIPAEVSGDSSVGLGVNWDGSVIVGTAENRINGTLSSRKFQAFTYTPGDSGFTILGGLVDTSSSLSISRAYAVSGSSATAGVVAGGSSRSRFSDRPYIITDAITGGSMTNWGGLVNTSSGAQALAINPTGTIVVGYSDRTLDVYRPNRAFRLDITNPSNVPQGLGGLPGGDYDSEANDLTDDGKIVVGWSFSNSGGQPLSMDAFYWVDDGSSNPDGSIGTMIGLGDLPYGEFWAEATGVSADGRVVVGQGRGVEYADNAGADRAAVWFMDPDNPTSVEPVELSSLLTEVMVGYEDYRLVRATGVSPDGTVITGIARHIVDGADIAFVATIPALVPEPAVIGAFSAVGLMLFAFVRRRRRAE